MSETNYSSILDKRVPRRSWSFHQKALAAVLLFRIVPLLLSALLILLMIIADAPG